MTTIHADELRPGDVVVYEGQSAARAFFGRCEDVGVRKSTNESEAAQIGWGGGAVGRRWSTTGGGSSPTWRRRRAATVDTAAAHRYCSILKRFTPSDSGPKGEGGVGNE